MKCTYNPFIFLFIFLTTAVSFPTTLKFLFHGKENRNPKAKSFVYEFYKLSREKRCSI